MHDSYLVTALEWVVEHEDSVRELVLLGDMFDIWTHPPSVRPPSLAEIIEANPATLGAGGALARVVAALPEALTLLLGNHDGTLTQKDIDQLSATVGPIRLVEPVHVLAGDNGAKTAFSHGHYWTMFNAPDDSSPWNRLPVGHFVTRAFAFEMANKLKPGQTVADLPNMGAPNGFDPGQFLRSLQPTLDPSLARLLLDYVSTVAGMFQNLTIILRDGSTTSIEQAKRIYENLFTRWVAKERREQGHRCAASVRGPMGRLPRVVRPATRVASQQRPRRDGSHACADRRLDRVARQLHQQRLRMPVQARHAAQKSSPSPSSTSSTRAPRSSGSRRRKPGTA